jgi:hypothetical protein
MKALSPIQWTIACYVDAARSSERASSLTDKEIYSRIVLFRRLDSMQCLVSEITTTMRVDDVVAIEPPLAIVVMFRCSHTVGILLAESNKLDESALIQTVIENTRYDFVHKFAHLT